MHVCSHVATGSCLEEDREKCAKEGMQGFLSKPLMAKHLEEIVGKYGTGGKRGSESASSLPTGGSASELSTATSPASASEHRALEQPASETKQNSPASPGQAVQ